VSMMPRHSWIRCALVAFIVGAVAGAFGCGEDKPCPQLARSAPNVAPTDILLRRPLQPSGRPPSKVA
jgi:hypothetical protein